MQNPSIFILHGICDSPKLLMQKGRTGHMQQETLLPAAQSNHKHQSYGFGILI